VESKSCGVMRRRRTELIMMLAMIGQCKMERDFVWRSGMVFVEHGLFVH
jgi:hypothetical protein